MPVETAPAAVPPKPPPRPAHTVLRLVGWVLLAAYFVAGAGFLVVRHLVWPRLDEWREPIEQTLSARIGLPVRIGRIETSFDRLRPLAVVHDLRVGDPAAGGLAVGEAEALLSWRSLLVGELRFDRLRASGPRVTVERLAERRWRVLGTTIDLDAPGEGGLADWLLVQGSVEIRDARLDFSDVRRARGLSLEGVGARLDSRGRTHRLHLSAAGGRDDAGAPIGALSLDAAVYREPFSRPADPAAWAGEADLALTGFDARTLGVFADLPLAAGRIDATARVALARGRPATGVLQWQAHDARVRLGEGEPLALREADAHLSLEWSGQTLTVRVGRLGLTAESGFALHAQGEGGFVEFDTSGGPPRAARLAIAAVDAAQAADFARGLPLPRALAVALAKMRFAGRVDEVVLDWPRTDGAVRAAGGLERLGVAFRFSELGFEFVDKRPAGRPGVPGFRRLSGSARVNATGGEAHIDARDAQLDFPGVFADRNIPFDSLAATVGWQVADAAHSRPFRLELRDVAFANPDMAGEMQGSFVGEGRGVGVVDYTGSLSRADAARVWRYLPLVIDEPVRKWVQQAIAGGRSSDLSFRLRGDMWDFPFRDPAKGEFRIAATIADGVLRYAPDWPAIEGFDGSLLFERAGMQVHLDTGRTFRVALAGVDARIADFREPLLKIAGKGTGPAQDMVRFVNESPIGTRIDDFTVDTRVDGDAALELALELPLGELERSRVRGNVLLAGNDLVLDTTLPPFSSVRGRLAFTEAGLALDGVEAGFLQGRVSVNGRTPAPGRFEIEASGTVPASGLRALADNPLTRGLAGETHYTARIDVDRRAARLRIESDLRGLSSSLPPPFEKSAGAAVPLTISSHPANASGPQARPAGDRIEVRLGKDARLAFERTRDPHTQRLSIQRGAFAYGTDPVLPPRGLAVRLVAPFFDADRWNALLHEPAQAKAQGPAGEPPLVEGFALLPEQVAIVADRLRFAGKDLNDVVFGATREREQWRASVRAREVEGYFVWLDAAPGQPMGAITARFARLEIPRSRADEVESMLQESPGELPALDVVADSFVLGGRKLGRLDLGARYEGGVWQIGRLRLDSDAARLSATGRWSGAGGSGRTTQLEFELALDDAGELLARMGFPDTVRGGTGTLAGKLDWRGSPLAIDFASLGGSLSISIGRGQFLKSEPGIAKLIGVLSLQSLPRRLSLDFQDVFLKGFAFDQIRGEAHVEGGVVRTEDLAMTGVQAEVRISGSADLSRETQDLRVQVRPELNAGLASLAYAAIANPAVGLGSFLAQMLLRKPLQEIFGYEFRVTGSWSDPTVVQQSAPERLPAQALP